MAEMDVLRHVEVLSCVSGGSIIGAYYYLELKKMLEQKKDEKITQQDYIDQFSIRIPELLAKLDRMEKIYETVEDTPQAMQDEMAAQRKRLEALKAAKGDVISPLDL